jgi:ubiquinol-cytochrome c reductase cytochrome c1 subunit
MKILLSFLMLLSFCVNAASDKMHLDKAPIDLSDKQSLQRGARIFVNYCLNCHSANYMRYNRLMDIGLTENSIKENLLFTSNKVGDTMSIAMSADDSKEWFGASPPDLTVVARSRGVDWIYSYMRGFYRDKTREMGWNNKVYLNSAMPHILWELQGEQTLDANSGNLSLIKPGNLTEKEYDSLAADLTNYLAFMSEPVKLKRQKIGLYVLGFLILLLFLSVNLKREFWRDIK